MKTQIDPRICSVSPSLGLARWQGKGRTALAAGQKGTRTQKEREREVFDVVYKNN